MSSIRQTIEASYSKPTISIKIDNRPESGTYFYTTGDRIEGEVSIVAPVDIQFDEISITFEGTSRTWLEKFGASPATSGRTSMANTVSGSINMNKPTLENIPFLTAVQFLRLTQPINEATLPIPRMVTAGQAVKIPISFVIPECLLPDACSHAVENPYVQAAHLCLPPSLGDLMGQEGKDDMAPDMAHISYAIRVNVIRKETTGQNIILATVAHRVLVSPAVEDEPPAHIEEQRSSGYIFYKEKDLRKGFLGKKIGRFSMSAEQPRPLHIFPNYPCPAMTTVPISLSFAAVNWQTPPPPLGTMCIKLKTSTYFSTTRTTYIPTRGRSLKDLQVGSYSESTLLSSRCIANSAWALQTCRTSPTPFKPVYKATLLVPITEPKCKFLVSSFSTCYVTRHYSLDLSISLRTSHHLQYSLGLKIPLQVSNPSKISIADAADLDVFFTRHSIARPQEVNASAHVSATTTNSQLPSHMLQNLPNQPPPPGYSVFGGSVSGIPLRIPEPVGISPGCG